VRACSTWLMIALHSMLHLPPGSSEHTAQVTPQPPMRIFVLGARAESTLPPSHWQQLTYLFPRNYFEINFIGPEVGLPMLNKTDPRRLKGKGYKFTRENEFGVPSYTLHVNHNMTLTSLSASYDDLHDQFGPFDPYTDIFFSFSPGLGFPHQEGMVARNRSPEVETETQHASSVTTQPQVQAETTWKATLQKILSTKCPLFFTAFSPLDLQRDVSALYGTNPPSFRHGTSSRLKEFPDYVGAPAAPVGHIEGVTDEFELILTPGKNTFGSLKWEIAEWDVRVAVKANWGVWGIRGKKYEVVQKDQY
jgi:splicing suppressor protein 51